MPTVRLAFSPVPAYVRTARLVSVAVARRAGVAEELLDEVRLAVGDACGRAVARHVQHGIDDLVRVVMSDDGPYVVRVVDACGLDRFRVEGDGPSADEEAQAEDAEREDAERMADALLAGLVKDLDVRTLAEGREVRMSWPVRRRLANGLQD